MSDIVVKVKKVSEHAFTPFYVTAGSAGCDVQAIEGVTIKPGCRCLVRTGICLEVPRGYECQVRPRSGLALNHGVTVLNSPGTIDSDYRGELSVLLHNTSDWSFNVSPGDRIAQLVFAPVTIVSFDVVDQLSETGRSDGGWGSTGRK